MKTVVLGMQHTVCSILRPAHLCSGERYDMEQPVQKPTWMDKALIIAVFTFVIWALFFLPARASESFVLSFTICSESRCQEQTMTPPDGASMMDCVKQGQLIASQWLADNKPPGWTIKKYRCGPRQGAA